MHRTFKSNFVFNLPGRERQSLRNSTYFMHLNSNKTFPKRFCECFLCVIFGTSSKGYRHPVTIASLESLDIVCVCSFGWQNGVMREWRGIDYLIHQWSYERMDVESTNSSTNRDMRERIIGSWESNMLWFDGATSKSYIVNIWAFCPKVNHNMSQTFYSNVTRDRWQYSWHSAFQSQLLSEAGSRVK